MNLSLFARYDTLLKTEITRFKDLSFIADSESFERQVYHIRPLLSLILFLGGI